jgi:type I restriction enzyme S subunit
VIGDLNDAIVTDTTERITADAMANSSAKLVPEGSVLLAMYGSIGKLGIAGRSMATNQAIAFAQPDPGVSARYLFHYLHSQRSALAAVGKGATQKNISQTVLRSWPIPLPPPPEQERIVAAIEEHLSRLDAAEAALDSSRRRLAMLDQRLVDAAIEGEPVALMNVLSEPLRNGLSAPASSTGSIRVVTLTAVTRGEFVDSHTKLIEPGVRSVEDLWMRPGDVFIQRSNTPELVGSAALFSGTERWAIFPDLLIRVRADPQELEPAYLELALRSTPLRRYFQRAAQGIAGSMPKISQPIVEAAPVPLPSIARQRDIVRRVEGKRSIAQRTRSQAERSAVQARGLRRSVLTAAFSGQLVPQDPDDEPASVLLERIQAERASATPAKRPRKATAR